MLLERSRVVFNELRQGINEIGSLADPTVGELRLGTTPPMSAIASAVFNRLVPRYPRMTFALSVGATDVLLAPCASGTSSSSSADWPISSPTRISTWILCSTMNWP